MNDNQILFASIIVFALVISVLSVLFLFAGYGYVIHGDF